MDVSRHYVAQHTIVWCGTPGTVEPVFYNPTCFWDQNSWNQCSILPQIFSCVLGQPVMCDHSYWNQRLVVKHKFHCRGLNAHGIVKGCIFIHGKSVHMLNSKRFIFSLCVAQQENSALLTCNVCTCLFRGMGVSCLHGIGITVPTEPLFTDRITLYMEIFVSFSVFLNLKMLFLHKPSFSSWINESNMCVRTH